MHSFDDIIGTSEGMRNVLDAASRAAPTDASVFISGQVGTGKELLARAIHASSRRSARPFMTIHCAALPDHLIESELFGDERGSFTGQLPRGGLLEAAWGGTFFLDEITEMDMGLQARLLRAIQDACTRRLGSDVDIPMDVRWIAGTTLDPERAVRDGVLSRKLLDRLSDVLVRLPPLRERRDDIPALATHFLRRYAREYDLGDLRFSAGALRVLSAYGWGGNVRELENVVARIAWGCAPGQEITPENLPDELMLPR